VRLCFACARALNNLTKSAARQDKIEFVMERQRQPIAQLLRALVAANLLAACYEFDARPRVYVEGLKPDMLFVVELPRNTMQAGIEFATAKSRRPGEKPTGIRVLTWSDEGDNLYDGTLADTEFNQPVELDTYLSWAGPSVFPVHPLYGPQTARWLGVEVRAEPWLIAYDPVPEAGHYCLLDFMGAGIYGCGAWVDAILQFWVQCRGDLGQLIDCHRLHFVHAPAIVVLAIGPGPGVGQAVANTFYYWQMGDHAFLYDELGWRHAKLPPRRWNDPPLDLYDGSVPWSRPFASPAELARDAAPHLDRVWASFGRDIKPDNPMRGLVAALAEEFGAPPQE
jgi:hypothetical protein